MTFRNDAPNILPELIQWDEVGPEHNPACRLLAHIRIAHLDMHLEAREVEYDADRSQSAVEYEADYDMLCTVADSDFSTIEIKGREYFLFALPYGR